MQIRNTPLDYKENFRIADAMFEHANAMEAMERQDPIEDIDFTIEFWKWIHSVR